MKRIYTYGGKPSLRTLTVADLQAAKGQDRKFSQVDVSSLAEATAAVEAGIDVISTFCPRTAEIRTVAPHTFLLSSMMLTDYRQEEDVIDAAFEAMEDGADMVYTLRSLKMVETLAEMGMPVMGHLGLVPRHSTRLGGLRAIGKTADEAIELYKDFKRLESTGAVAVEIEVVPEKILAEINKRTSLITFSIGAGSAGDVQFVFMEDICGDNENPPRHAKSYGRMAEMRREIEAERVRCLKAYHEDVTSGRYPGPENVVGMAEPEYEKFMNELERLPD